MNKINGKVKVLYGYFLKRNTGEGGFFDSIKLSRVLSVFLELFEKDTEYLTERNQKTLNKLLDKV